jgi:hypothetical protein
MSERFSCPSCGSTSISLFYEVAQIPVHSVVLMHCKEEAQRIACGDIRLGLCHTCGLIANFAFQENLLNYAAEYESTQAYSPTFGTFHHQLATQLIARHDLYGKHIVEIGCGRGEFLKLLCRLGDNRGLGFDPAYGRGMDEDTETGNVKFIRDYYSEEYTDLPADFIVCKMTLEHIFETRAFAGLLRRALGSNTAAIVFVQVPDATRILKEAAFWDIHYEHCCYFTPTSLWALFQESGFYPIVVRRAYHDTYLIIEARPKTASKEYSLSGKAKVAEVEALVDHFEREIEGATARWKKSIRALNSGKQRVVIWGSSSKATAFLTTLGIASGIDYVVDINPYRQGTFMPGTGQRIVAPDFLKEYQPNDIIVINPIYCEEVTNTIEALGIKARVTTPQEKVLGS